MKVGPYNISIIGAGDFRLDGGAMFGVVPKRLWSRVCPTDESNRIAMTTNCLLIEGEGRRILVDTGLGHKESRNFVDIYGVDFSHHTLEDSLAACGVRTEDITDVILTHLHFDHVGGATRRAGEEIVPTFPNARHHVQKRHYDHALNPTERDRASFLPHNIEPLARAGLFEFTDGDTELFPGIHLIVVNGHTPGQQTVKISDGSNVIVWFAGDLLPMSAHVPLPYIMGYDLFPMTTLEEKKRLLPQATEERWVAVFEHDPSVPAARLIRTETGNFSRGEAVDV